MYVFNYYALNGDFGLAVFDLENRNQAKLFVNIQMYNATLGRFRTIEDRLKIFVENKYPTLTEGLEIAKKYYNIFNSLNTKNEIQEYYDFARKLIVKNAEELQLLTDIVKSINTKKYFANGGSNEGNMDRGFREKFSSMLDNLNELSISYEILDSIEPSNLGYALNKILARNVLIFNNDRLHVKETRLAENNLEELINNAKNDTIYRRVFKGVNGNIKPDSIKSDYSVDSNYPASTSRYAREIIHQISGDIFMNNLSLSPHSNPYMNIGKSNALSNMTKAIERINTTILDSQKVAEQLLLICDNLHRRSQTTQEEKLEVFTELLDESTKNAISNIINGILTLDDNTNSDLYYFCELFLNSYKEYRNNLISIEEVVMPKTLIDVVEESKEIFPVHITYFSHN